MNDNADSPGQFTSPGTDTEARTQYVTGHPPRLAPVAPQERTERQQQLLDEIGMVVVDGVRKERTDKAALDILVRHAELYEAHMDVARKFLSDGEMSIRDRELAILRLAWLCQAPFEWGAHVNIAKRNNVTSEEIARIIEGSSADGWETHDRAILRAMEELHFDSMITDKTWDELQASYNDKQLIELIILAGQYKTVAYYQNALRLPLPENNLGLSAR